MTWDLVKDCTVAIASSEGNILGTGFFISLDGKLLTCAHVVEDAGGGEEVRVHGQAVSVLYLGDRNSDNFAVLQVANYQGKAVPLSLNFTPKDEFVTIGYGRPDFREGGCIDGVITDKNPQVNFDNLPMLRWRIMADAQQIQGGYSGSPVYNNKTKSVIGLIAAWDDKNGVLVVPLRTVKHKWRPFEEILNPIVTALKLEFQQDMMTLDSRFYINREPLETRCYQEIEKLGSLIRIKAPEQMGKTSVLSRIIHHAQEQGYRAVYLSFGETEESNFQDLNKFLQWFCTSISGKLEISPQNLDDYWNDEFFGPMVNCTKYFTKCLLVNNSSPLVLCLDDLEQIFPYNTVAKEFLKLLRSWNEKAKTHSTWEKLRLVLAYSTESYVNIDSNCSPFNVGEYFDLPEFNLVELQALTKYHGLSYNHREIEQLIRMVGGHPYLVRLALYRLASQDITLSKLLEDAPTETGIYGNHLRRHLQRLQQYPDLMAAFKKVLITTLPVSLDSKLAFQLNGMGLVNLQGKNVTLRYENLYRPYFEKRWTING